MCLNCVWDLSQKHTTSILIGEVNSLHKPSNFISRPFITPKEGDGLLGMVYRNRNGEKRNCKKKIGLFKCIARIKSHRKQKGHEQRTEAGIVFSLSLKGLRRRNSKAV